MKNIQTLRNLICLYISYYYLNIKYKKNLYEKFN